MEMIEMKGFWLTPCLTRLAGSPFLVCFRKNLHDLLQLDREPFSAVDADGRERSLPHRSLSKRPKALSTTHPQTGKNQQT